MPTMFAHCEHCMEVMHATGMTPYSEQLEGYPEDVKKQYFQLSEIAQKLKAEFDDRVVFDPVDSASPQGVWLSIRHRILRTPCILIQGNKVFNKFPGYEELRATILDALERSGRIASTRVGASTVPPQASENQRCSDLSISQPNHSVRPVGSRNRHPSSRPCTPA